MAQMGKATVRIDDAAIKARMRDLLAQAWAAGYHKGADDHYMCGGICKVDSDSPNPYRDEAQA
jgi:hypothetical protein